MLISSLVLTSCLMSAYIEVPKRETNLYRGRAGSVKQKLEVKMG